MEIRLELLRIFSNNEIQWHDTWNATGIAPGPRAGMMTRQFWLIAILITAFLPWPQTEQCFSMAFAPGAQNNRSDTCENEFRGHAQQRPAWSGTFADPLNDESIVLCEFEEEEREEDESAGKQVRDLWATKWFDTAIASRLAGASLVIRTSSEAGVLYFPMVKSQIVCRC